MAGNIEHDITYRHKQCEFSRIGSKHPQRFFRRRESASELLQNTLVTVDEYGVKPTDSDDIALPACEIGLASFDEPSTYHFFSFYEHRLQTFLDFQWPLALKVLVVPLATFGYFYKKESSIVYCYYCGGADANWLPPESSEEMIYYPMIIHSTTSHKCPLVKPYYYDPLFREAYLAYDVKHTTCFLRVFLNNIGAAESVIAKYYVNYAKMMKKRRKTAKSNRHIQRYISRKEAPDNPSSEKSVDVLNEKVAQLESEALCGICLKNRKNICFTPCGHTFACLSCYRTSTHGGRKRIVCYVCRGKITGFIHIYL